MAVAKIADNIDRTTNPNPTDFEHEIHMAPSRSWGNNTLQLEALTTRCFAIELECLLSETVIYRFCDVFLVFLLYFTLLSCI